MKKKNVVDFDAYKKERNLAEAAEAIAISEELEQAIEVLIQRLKESRRIGKQ